MKKILLCLLLTNFVAYGQNSMNTSASDSWIGYINVFELNGAYINGFVSQVPDNKTVLDVPGDLITLHPNFKQYQDNPTEPYWVNQTTGEGAKILETSTYVEPGATFNEVDLTFAGSVVSNTLSVNYEAKFFIKALDPNNGYQDALNGTKVFDIPASGNFSVSALGTELTTGLIIQYGFSIRGLNANPADEASLGNIVITGAQCNVDVTTTTSNTTIEATAANLNYQWLNCDDNYSVIPGATSQSFTAAQNGNYAVQITDGVCVDTSDCVQISTVSLSEMTNNHGVKVYPNPAQNTIHIDNFNAYESYKIVDLQGKTLLANSIANTVNIESLEQGQYFIHLFNDNSYAVVKFIKM
jgi:hypothetical protein